jgi:hypothetical protein
MQSLSQFLTAAILVRVDMRSECEAIGRNEKLISIPTAQFQQPVSEPGNR